MGWSLFLGNNSFCRLARWPIVFEITLGIMIIWLDLISIVNFRLLTVTHDITLHSAFHSLLCADNCLGCWVEKNIAHCHSKCTVCVGKIGNRGLIKGRPRDNRYPVDIIVIFLKQSVKASDCLWSLLPRDDIHRGRVGRKHRQPLYTKGFPNSSSNACQHSASIVFHSGQKLLSYCNESVNKWVSIKWR